LTASLVLCFYLLTEVNAVSIVNLQQLLVPRVGFLTTGWAKKTGTVFVYANNFIKC